MNSFFKILERDSVKEAVEDVITVLLVERLKDDYIHCLDWDDVENASAILTVLRYFMVYEDFKAFLEEVKDAGYTVAREF